MLTSTTGSAQLARSYWTVDGDRIEISARDGRGDGQVRLCLDARPGGTSRQVRIADVGILQSVDGARSCLTIPARETRLEFIKSAKGGLALTVGQMKLDLSGYGSGTVTLNWGAN